jgi:menaquinone-dependent protoporphyrinogen oxidase
MHIYYATRDGQSRRIAGRIAERLSRQNITAVPYDLAIAPPAPADVALNPVVVLIASVRYGRHLPETDRFLAAYRSLAPPPALALASVNLTARKPGKDTPEGNAYFRKLVERHRLKPALAAVFAGRLDYPRYGWFDRQIIRFIMLLTGGPTDPQATVDYTSWPAVDAFAGRIADLCRDAEQVTQPARRA